MNGPFYHDSLLPFLITDVASVTLATTDKALYPAANAPTFGNTYWWAGKRLRISMSGRITTVLTPGNGSFTVYWGTGADANGTALGTSTINTLIASQTNLTWRATFDIHCRAIGATGSLLVTGEAFMNEAVCTAKYLLPASAPAATTVDLTSSSNVLSVNFKRSGSTAETMQVHEVLFQPLN